MTLRVRNSTDTLRRVRTRNLVFAPVTEIRYFVRVRFVSLDNSCEVLMKRKMTYGLPILLFALLPSTLFASWGGASDDDLIILALMFFPLIGFGASLLIRYTRESVIPAMQVMMNPPKQRAPRPCGDEENDTAAAETMDAAAASPEFRAPVAG
jgi:hypothetical protein